MRRSRRTAIVGVLLAAVAAACVSPAGAKTSGDHGAATVDQAALAQVALRMMAVLDRPSPKLPQVKTPTAKPGDSGDYACTKLAAGEVSAVAGGAAVVPRPNGGRPASGPLPASSVCVYAAATADAAPPFMVTLTANTFASPDAARQALYDRYGNTDSRNIAGIGNGAFIFPNGTPAYVAAGSDVVQLDLIAPPGTDTAAAFTALLRAVAGHADRPALAPTPPVPTEDDLDPCLLTPAEVQKILGVGPVTRARTFADVNTDRACVYTLPESVGREIIVSTFTASSLATSGQTVAERYETDRQSTTGVSDIPGFPTPAKPLSPADARKYATVWGFGNDDQVEIVVPGSSAGSGPRARRPSAGSAAASGGAVPPTPLVPARNQRRIRDLDDNQWGNFGVLMYALKAHMSMYGDYDPSR